jgi:undecaprenyl-diphosphatase
MMAVLRRLRTTLIVFLKDWQSPGGCRARRFVIGMLTAFLAAGWFLVAAAGLRSTGAATATDLRVAHWCREHATPAAIRFAEVVTFFGSAGLLIPAGIAVALLLLRRREWCWTTALVLTVGGGSLLNVVLKNLVHRPRPEFDQPLIEASGYSFPSGHTMAAMIFYGFLAATIVTHLRRWRMFAPMLALLLVISIGLSRVYLGAHYLSDVTAAAAAGFAWLALCLVGIEIIPCPAPGRPIVPPCTSRS